MRREGSALHGFGVVTLKELADHFTSILVVVLVVLVVATAVAVVRGAVDQIKEITAEDPFLFLRLFTRGGAAAAGGAAVVPGAADRDRARLRLGERRAQPAHALAHPVAADLSRRAAVREVRRRAVHALDQPDRAVAAGDRARTARARAFPRTPRRWRVRSSCSWSRSPMPASGSRSRCCSRSSSAPPRRPRWSRSGCGCS